MQLAVLYIGNRSHMSVPMAYCYSLGHMCLSTCHSRDMSVQNVGEDGDGQCLHSQHGRCINANQRK